MIQAMIDFIAPLTVGQTAALALGMVAVAAALPQIVCGVINTAAGLVRCCTDAVSFDPAWMDARLYRQMEREEQAARRRGYPARGKNGGRH